MGGAYVGIVMEPLNPNVSNVIPFPHVDRPPQPTPPTPKFDRIAERAGRLAKLSNYPCEFDFDIYKRLETRFGANQPRGGVVFQIPFKLVNSHNTCQQCLYAFEVDTYGRGCIHNCVYCYTEEDTKRIATDMSNDKNFPTKPFDYSEI